MSILGTKCPECGAFILGRARFCGRCGFDLLGDLMPPVGQSAERFGFPVRPVETPLPTEPEPKTPEPEQKIPEMEPERKTPEPDWVIPEPDWVAPEPTEADTLVWDVPEFDPENELVREEPAFDLNGEALRPAPEPPVEDELVWEKDEPEPEPAPAEPEPKRDAPEPVGEDKPARPEPERNPAGPVRTATATARKVPRPVELSEPSHLSEPLRKLPERRVSEPKPTETFRKMPEPQIPEPSYLSRPLRKAPEQKYSQPAAAKTERRMPEPADTEPEETAPTTGTAGLKGFGWMSRSNLIKLICAGIGALAIILAIVLVARMTRKQAAPEPEAAVPVSVSQTVHTIEGEGIILPTAKPTAAPAAKPTLPPASVTPLPAAPPRMVSEVSGYVYAGAPTVMVYEAPDENSSVIAIAVQGEALTRTGVLDGWTRVLVSGAEGYVRHGDIVMDPEPTPLPELDFEVDDRDETVVVDGGGNVRIGPGTDYAVYDYVIDGAELHRTGVINGWSQVEYDGRRVYIYDELLRSDEATPTPAPTAEPQPQEMQSESVSRSVTLRMNANIRTGPGMEYDAIGIANGGDVLQATELVDGWYKVSFAGQTGYVLGTLVE